MREDGGAQTGADGGMGDGGALTASDAGGGDGGSVSDAGGNVPDGGAPTPFHIGVCAYQTRDFAALQSLGLKWVRLDRPSAETIELARTFGIEVLPIAAYGYPDLSGQTSDHYPPLPQNRAAWARRVVDLWRTMARPPKVIEVWNEPFQSGFWLPSADAVAYLELFKAFAAEAWAQWPDVTLLVSAGTIGYDNNQYPFRQTLLAADTSGFLNDPRIHPTDHVYVEARTPSQVTGEPCKFDLNRYECAYDDFKRHGHPNPTVWITEYGWESTTDGGTGSMAKVSEQTQADHHLAALEQFRASGKVAAAFSYMFNTNDTWNYNWLRPDNTQKPVCAAMKAYLTSH